MLRAFIKLNGEDIPLEFYKYDKSKLYLSDELHKLLTSKDRIELLDEVDARWG